MDTEYTSKNLDHLGIVSVICDEIKLKSTLDGLITPDPQMTITLGECLKLMIINGLGFSSRPLYLEAQFFESRPVERFLGRECASEINDDRLGRALDRFYAFGCDRLFAILASQAAIRYGISQKFKHLDSTSMEVHGEYKTEEERPLITFGYSKGHRPDLKQFMIYLMSSQDGDVPLLAQTVEGNSSDKKLFRENLKALKDQIQQGTESYFIADSALYTAETIEEISLKMKWITRVPEKIVEAKTLMMSKEKLEEIEPGYLGREVKSTYGEIEQRWLLVYSEQAYAREEKTLRRQLSQEFEKKSAELKKKLCSQEFDCEKDAEKTLKKWVRGLKYHRLTKFQIAISHVKKTRGRPRLSEAVANRYRIVATIEEDPELVNQSLSTKGRFIVASNELDVEKLSSKEMLSNYKEQQSVERGFRFLKDPFFMTSSVFLKNQNRIIALGMVMCLCLLCYTIAQRLLRKKLEELRVSIPNQVGKPTQRPTMRWIFQLFEGVHLLIQKISSGVYERVLNLNKTRNQILAVLGPKFEKMYSGT